MAAQEVLPIELELKPQSLVPSTPTPMDLLQMAVAQNLGVDQLEKLIQLAREVKADAAREAFVRAMTEFKKVPLVITKSKGVTVSKAADAQPAYFYAPLDQVCKIVVPALNAVGISHAWETAYDGDYMIVTCVLTHEQGHKERSSMRGKADTSGAKNAIQAEASTLNYLERYTLLAVTGIAAANADNDGATNGEVAEYVEWIMNAGDRAELKKMFEQAWNKFEKDNPVALKVVVAANRKRREELS